MMTAGCVSYYSKRIGWRERECVEKEKDQTRDNLEGYKIQGEEEEPSMRSEIQLER